MSPAPTRNDAPLPSDGAIFSRTLALVSTGALVVLGIAWETVLSPRPGGSGRLAWKVLPLVLALPGLLHYRLLTYRWLSLLIWVYVAEGLVRGVTETGTVRLLAVIEVLLGLLVFSACAFHVRARLRAGQTGATPVPP